ncbi:DUF6950 family protein [Sphingomonas melonis]|uniref:DUF6950 family protein n=1 Tax=Sphingomonas melonis TaxID=152682 RepID=UPI0035C7F829
MADPDWSHHCGDLWRAHVLAATGRDICDIVGPTPRRARDWVAMMRRLGARDMAGVIAAVHGPAIDTRLARRGDIVQIGWAIGVCRGELEEFYGGVMVPAKRTERAWQLQTLLHVLPFRSDNALPAFH